MMNDLVKYQLDKAVDALRTAVKLGADKEDAYLLRNIVETINTIEGWQTSLRFKTDTSNDFFVSSQPPIAYYSADDTALTFS